MSSQARDIGDVYASNIVVRDANGDPADAGDVTCTVTYPDGTSDTLHVLKTGTGTYSTGVPITMAGQHVLQWQATGVNASAWPDVFTATDPNLYPVVSLSEAKDYLNITGTGSDEELRRFLDVITAKGEEVTGRVFGRRTVVETVDGEGEYVVLRHNPVISVQSVTYGDATIPASAYRLRREAGLLRYVGGEWPDSDDGTDLVVSYQAGYLSQPEQDRHGALVLLKHLWSTQRGSIRRGGDSDEWNPAMAFSIPRRVQEMWASEVPRMGL